MINSTAPDQVEIAARLKEINTDIAALAGLYQRDANDIQLMAVSKTHPSEAIEQAIAAGQRLFGENRVQEAAQKFPALKAKYKDIKLHLIGPLQSNKARQAVQLFDEIHSLDRPKLVDTLAKLQQELGHCPPLYIQVNTGREAQKSGIMPEDLTDLLAKARAARLPVIGLMCVPPIDEMPAPHFAWLAEAAKANGLSRLSMGMSHDYSAAIAAGANIIRIGTAIFGKR